MAIPNGKKTTISSSAAKAVDELLKTNKDIESLQLGVTKKDLIDNGDTKKSIEDINDIVRQSFKKLVGDNYELSGDEINYILQLASNKDKNSKETSAQQKKRFEEFKTMIVSQNDSGMKDMLSTRKHSKLQLYASYELIITIIPKMKLALDTWVNSIISPDDFNKNSLLSKVNNYTNDEDTAFITKSLKNLFKKFKIEDKLKENVKDYLVKGEVFFAILSMNDQIKQMLKEENSHMIEESYRKVTSFENSLLTEGKGFLKSDNELLIEEGCKIFGEKDKDLDRTLLIEHLNFIIENGLIVGSSANIINENNKQEDALSTAVAKSSSRSPNEAISGKKDNADQVDDIKIDEDSAILKKLVPENVVKLEFNDKCFGYVYVDTLESKTENLSFNGTQNINITSNSPMGTVLYSGKDVPANAEGLGTVGGELGIAVDAKLMFIASAFANRLSASENISMLKNNPDLKNAIYYSLKTKDILKKEKMRFTFFKPSEVVHINRGSSIFDNILFFAKIYIASLITILMQNIVRGSDKRAYYINVSLENDISNTVQQVIKDVKSKDISGLHNMDIFSVLNVVGEFSDYYFPTIDDTKPISIDTVQGLSNTSLDNDFLNWLSNNIFSGMGLPSAYLTEVENIDFAKTLSMQNTRFIRDIVAEQGVLSKGYSELVRLLYTKEFIDSGKFKDSIEANSARSKSKGKGKNSDEVISTYEIINPEDIDVFFPSPMSLNMTNLTEQISNLGSFIDAVSADIDWGAQDKEKANSLFKHEIMRTYLSNVDWEFIDNVISRVKVKMNKNTIKGNIKDKADATDLADGSSPSDDTSTEGDTSMDTGTEDTGTDTGVDDTTGTDTGPEAPPTE